MRIIIEVEPGASQAVVEMEGSASEANTPHAFDGGPPVPELLEALGEAAEDVSSLRGAEEVHPASPHPEDAGAVPDWLVASVELDQHQPHPRQDGGS